MSSKFSEGQDLLHLEVKVKKRKRAQTSREREREEKNLMTNRWHKNTRGVTRGESFSSTTKG